VAALWRDLCLGAGERIDVDAATRAERTAAWKAMAAYVYPRQKSIDITSKKEVEHRYVISIPAPSADSDLKIIDAGPPLASPPDTKEKS
jgi:hypothetical protein